MDASLRTSRIGDNSPNEETGTPRKVTDREVVGRATTEATATGLAKTGNATTTAIAHSAHRMGLIATEEELRIEEAAGRMLPGPRRKKE